MQNLSELIQHGATNVWLFIPSAIVLGALHGLEPGHSKTMMAAFIIAVRGTVAQAMLLGLCAAFSHTLVIWALAAIALKFGSHWNTETVAPYLQIGSAILILSLAIWMFFRTRRDIADEHAHHHRNHHHDHEHSHDDLAVSDYEDDHERAHAEDIERRFAGRSVTTAQIALFGLTGGLIPCPAALTILLVCLQLKKFSLGFTLVGAFSVGLAITLVAIGALAAWSLHHAQKHFRGFGKIARKLPYISCVILALLALFIGIHGWLSLR